MKCKNILIVEAYTDANIGSGALVENSLKILHQKYPGANLRVMAHNPGVFHKLYGVDAVDDIFNYPFGLSRSRQFVWLMWTCLWMMLCLGAILLLPLKWTTRLPVVKSKLQDFVWSDIVVSVGAERINDKFFKNIIFSLYTYNLVIKLGKKMVIFPSTIGPFLFGWTRWLSARVLKHVDLIYTRDDQSEKTTLSLPEMPENKVCNTSDVAVLQDMISFDQALRLIPATSDEKLVGISVMKWSYFKNRIETPYSNYTAYVREMAKFADNIIEEYGVVVVLYPTNYPVHGCREDDVITAYEVRDIMKHKISVRIIKDLPTPSEFKGMLACSEVNITTRMHACILSTGAFVPTISVNYLFKLAEYMNSLGLSEFSIDIEEFCSDKALLAFRQIWPKRSLWRSHLEGAISNKQDRLLQSMEAFDVIL